jgi:hypothetical protein
MKRLLLQVVLDKVVVPAAMDTLRPFLKNVGATALSHGAKALEVLRDFSEEMRVLCIEHGNQLKENRSKY